jgi:hypothetical protein
MNRPLVLPVVAAITLAAMVGCNKNKDTESSASGAAPAASVAPVTADSLPPRAEEEQKASAEITPDNYKTQLDQIEKEIEQP